MAPSFVVKGNALAASESSRERQRACEPVRREVSLRREAGRAAGKSKCPELDAANITPALNMQLRLGAGKRRAGPLQRGKLCHLHDPLRPSKRPELHPPWPCLVTGLHPLCRAGTYLPLPSHLPLKRRGQTWVRGSVW